MEFQDALGYLNSFINYEKKKNVVYDEDHYNLESFNELTKIFGRPQDAVPSFHVTGTKGKGSVTEYIKNGLMACGYKTGCFTSPHIVNVRERIRLNNEMISEKEFARITEIMKPETGDREKKYRTFFELITLMSFMAFRDAQMDYAVYEVGMGGRLDSTNVVMPEACVINTVALDHTETLGDTLEKIAFEKSGIMKKGRPVIIGPQKEEIKAYLKKRAAETGAPAFVYGEDFFAEDDGTVVIKGAEYGPLNLKMPGRRQLDTAACALCSLCAAGLFNGNEDKIIRAMEKTVIKGRIEVFEKYDRIMVFDTGHTAESAAILFKTVKGLYPEKKIWSVTSFSSGKNINAMLKTIKEAGTKAIYTANSSFRAEDPEAMAEIIEPFMVIRDPAEAVEKALELSTPGDVIVVHGSFYLIGDIYERFR